MGVLGAFNNNTISNNIITQNAYCIAVYADHYDVAGNYLGNSIYVVRIKGNYNGISENQIMNNYGGFLISSSLGIVIVENNIANNSEVVNIEDYNSSFEVYHNDFIIDAHSKIVTTLGDELPGLGWVGGVMPPWDDGKEGNYWSDYAIRYPSAHEIGDSGIGDSPYMIRVDPSITDRYPLIMPIKIQNTILPASSRTPFQTSTPSPSSSPSPNPSSSNSPTPTPSASTEPHQKGNSSSLPTWMFWVIAAVAIISVLSTVAVFLKKKSVRKLSQ